MVERGLIFFILSFWVVATSPLAQTTNSNQLDFEAATKLLDKGAYQEALQKLDKLVYSGYSDKSIYRYRGFAKFHLSDFKGAAEDLDLRRIGGDGQGQHNFKITLIINRIALGIQVYSDLRLPLLLE